LEVGRSGYDDEEMWVCLIKQTADGTVNSNGVRQRPKGNVLGLYFGNVQFEIRP
jgi:hypothetical protein